MVIKVNFVELVVCPDLMHAMKIAHSRFCESRFILLRSYCINQVWYCWIFCVFGLIPLFFNLPVKTEEKAIPGRRAEAGKALNPRDHLSHLLDRSLVSWMYPIPSVS